MNSSSRLISKIAFLIALFPTSFLANGERDVLRTLEPGAPVFIDDKNFYEILGVPDYADEKVVKEAAVKKFDKLEQQYKRFSFSGENAQKIKKRLEIIVQIEKYLSNPQTKAEYDARLRLHKDYLRRKK